MFRPLLRAFARLLLQPDQPGRALAAWSGPSGWLQIQRQVALEQRFARRVRRLFADHTVHSGPFAGLRYASHQAHGSALWPKLLGTYESELDPVFARFRRQTYDDVIDIGFAEGYYLVGLAGWFPSARAWGFDPSPEAHRLCAGLAAANGLPPDRLRLAGAVADTLLAPALSGRSLVVCDCEGCEAELFAPSRIHFWHRSDLVIECHDFVSPGITDAIRTNLSPSHRVQTIRALSPDAKLPRLEGRAYRHLARDEKLRLLFEGRPPTQDWLVAEPLR